MRFPDLKENQIIIPSTTKLTFNISLAGTDVNRTLVGNLGRNIIRKLVMKLEGNEIISIDDDYDVLYSYYDCRKTTTERLAIGGYLLYSKFKKPERKLIDVLAPPIVKTNTEPKTDIFEML